MRRACDAGWARRRRNRGRYGAPGEFRAAVLEGRGARRDARARDTPAASDAAPARRHARPRRLGSGADTRGERLAASHRTPRAGFGRVLSVGAAAHRGLLRRQQADEGFSRLGQRRHQFAAVHGLLGRRPSPRVRRGHGAGPLRGPGPGRPDRADRIERRVVPSGAVPAHPGQSTRARREAGRDRSAPHRDRRRGRPASRHQARHGHGAVLRPAGAAGRPRRLRSRLRGGPHHRIRRRAAARDRDRAGCRDGRARDRARCRRCADFPRPVRRDAAHRHLLLAGREPVGAGHRQGQRDHQLPPRHGTHRQARHGAVLAHRPTERDGRARSRRARQPARRAHEFLSPRDRPRAALLGCAADRDA